MSPAQLLAEHKKTIDKFAWKVLRRVHAVGLRAVDLDDVKQELSIALLKAAECWKAEHGVPFGPYMMTGMKRHVNRWIENQAYEDQNSNMSLDNSYSGFDGETATLENILPSGEKPADEVLHEKLWRSNLRAKLSKRAEQFIAFLENPPEELVQIFRAKSAKVEFARSRGINTFMQSTISEALVFDFLGATRSERGKIRREISEAVNKVARA